MKIKKGRTPFYAWNISIVTAHNGYKKCIVIYMGRLHIQIYFIDTGNYPEDHHLENGNYQCKCIDCGNIFYGHKRRFICKKCLRKAKKKDKKMKRIALFARKPYNARKYKKDHQSIKREYVHVKINDNIEGMEFDKYIIVDDFMKPGYSLVEKEREMFRQVFLRLKRKRPTGKIYEDQYGNKRSW